MRVERKVRDYAYSLLEMHQYHAGTLLFERSVPVVRVFYITWSYIYVYSMQ